MRKPMEIYDYGRRRSVQGVFRSVRELDSGAQLGYFESSEYANTLVIMILFPDGTYFVAERFHCIMGRPS